MTAPVNCPELKPSTSTFVRWCKFNLVGGMGIVVQFVALFLLKSGLHFDYLLATAVAVEAAVVHNFVWHEQFTWVDRVSPHPFKEETIRTKAETICTKAETICTKADPIATKAETIRISAEAIRIRRRLQAARKSSKTVAPLGAAETAGATAERYRQSLRRLLRFNLTNGAVSILGNLALMKVMVGQGHMNYLLANAIAITLCSLANFLVSDAWVFERR